MAERECDHRQGLAEGRDRLLFFFKWHQDHGGCFDRPVLSLGFQGFWIQNGVLNDVPLGSEAIHSFLKKGEPLQRVVEGYEVGNKEVITFEKSLFGSDPDVLEE